MASQHDNIDAVQKELTEMLRIRMITSTQFKSAMIYVATNREQVLDTLGYASVGDTVDGIVDTVRACSTGRCAS